MLRRINRQSVARCRSNCAGMCLLKLSKATFYLLFFDEASSQVRTVLSVSIAFFANALV